MPVPTHFKFTFRGVFANTPEIWVFGCHMSRDNDAGLDASINDVSESGVTAALDSLITGSGAASFQASVLATDWRCYEIGVDGKMVGNPLVVDVTGETIQGSGAFAKYPPQVSLCATLVANNRGPARYGRMYLPGPGATLQNDGRLLPATAMEYAVLTQAFLKNVSDAIDLEALQSAEGLNISSRGGVDGTRQTIDHVEVGRVLDTIRSRRTSLLEDRQADSHIDW